MGALRRMPSIGASLRMVIQASMLVLVTGASVYLYVRLREAIIAGFNAQLVAAGSTISAALRGYPVTDCLGFQGQPDSVMRATEEWRLLRGVQERADLTYAYTFILSGDSGITYLVDGSPEGSACAIGQHESLPAENAKGLRRAWSTGLPFVSRVLRFEHWGLLKVSATPIADSSGTAVALAGADLEVSVIRERVRSGVSIAVGASLAVLALAWLFAFYTEQRILGALRETTRALIGIAAGDEHALLPHPGSYPVEVAAMNTEVNRSLAAMREARDVPEGRSGDDNRLTVRWRSRSPTLASCVLLGEYVVAWRRRDRAAPLFFFGPARGPVQLIREYLRLTPDADRFTWTHPAGLMPFFEGVWWVHTGTGRTGSLGSAPDSWLAMARGALVPPPGEHLLAVSVQESTTV
jgi:hypothetical protein